MTEKAPERLMTRKEYAEHRGVSVPAVRKAIISGRIAKAQRPGNMIAVDAADALWAAVTHPWNGGNRLKKPDSHETKETEVENLREQARELGVDPDDVPDINESRALLIACQAELASIEVDQKRGELMPVSEHESILAKFSRSARDAMLAIPDRLAAEIVGMTDAALAHAKMTTEIRSAIERMLEHAPD